MTIRQYFATFFQGLTDYLGDVYRDGLVADLLQCDKDVINKEYAFAWKEGNLRHYVNQRRMALRGKVMLGKKWYDNETFPADGKLCLVEYRKKQYLLKYDARSLRFCSFHDGKEQTEIFIGNVKRWAYYVEQEKKGKKHGK